MISREPATWPGVRPGVWPANWSGAWSAIWSGAWSAIWSDVWFGARYRAVKIAAGSAGAVRQAAGCQSCPARALCGVGA